MTACEEYCGSYLANCGDSDANTYDDEGDCNATCYGADWPIGMGQQPGTISCRTAHAEFAEAMQDPHCYHSAEEPSMGGCQ
jgi:hypothetical protein